MTINTLEEFNSDTQKVLVSYLISDPNAFALTQNIVKPEYFDSGMKKAVSYIMEYSNEWRALPTPEQIHAATKISLDYFPDTNGNHNEWFCATMERFCRHKALELVILDGVDLLAKGEGAEVERRTREAMTISLIKDLGTSYFDDPQTRLQRMRDNSNTVSTGWAALDNKVNGGFTPGSLNVFCGGSGAGKSLFLQNIARNWALTGMNVVYFTLELSEDLVAQRMDTMSSRISSREVMGRINEVAIAVKTLGKNAGDLIIKKMPEAGTTTNDLRAYLKEYEIQTGKKFDALVVDYLDLMHPNSGKVNPSDLFVKDKYVSEELRSLAGEMGVPLVTASQLNRCVSPDTMVLLQSGENVMVSQLKEGDLILGKDGYVEVKHVFPTEQKPAYRIKLKSGKEIVCSANHRFPTEAGLLSIETGLTVGHKIT